MQIARRDELEFMDKLSRLKEVTVEQCGLETNSKPLETELKVRQIKIGILRNDLFSATPPLEAARLLMSLMMIGSKHAKSYKLMFIDIVRAHFHSPSRRRVFVELFSETEREVSLVWLVTQEIVRNTRGGGFRNVRHEHTDEHQIRGWNINPCSCKHANKDIRLFYHGDDFVILADENDLQWFAEELNERESPRSARWR